MFLNELEEIQRTRLAKNLRLSGTRFAIGAAVRNQLGEAVAAVTLVGPSSDIQPRAAKLGKILLRHVDGWSHRSVSAREAI